LVEGTLLGRRTTPENVIVADALGGLSDLAKIRQQTRRASPSTGEVNEQTWLLLLLLLLHTDAWMTDLSATREIELPKSRGCRCASAACSGDASGKRAGDNEGVCRDESVDVRC
jgi:hypothetical protein